MQHTIKVPRNRLKPTLRFGFLISPAMKVTPSQATLENIEPTKAAEIADIKTIPLIGIQVPVATSSDFDPQASTQLASQTSAFAAMKPKTISPANDRILITVNTVCRILEFFTPRLLTSL